MVRKVLVVDDEHPFGEFVCEVLLGRRYEVTMARCGIEAVEAYRLDSPDMVLLDFRMPGMNGLETLRELKALDPGARVVMLTASQEQDIAEEARRMGAFDFLTKPITYDYLVEYIGSIGSPR